MKELINLTNKYIVLATPLILFTLITSVYFSLSISNGKIINIIISLLLSLLMSTAFMAGWFKMVKLAVENPNRQDPNSVIKEFVSGVGEYFLPSLGSIFVILIINVLILTISYFAGMHFIGNPNISPEAFSKALANTEALKQFLSGLTSDQLVKISIWNMFLLGTMAINWFLIMFYMPALFLQSKNPFCAYFLSVKALFGRYFIKNFGIFILIFSVYFVISILSALFAANPVLNFLMTLVNFYFICMVVLGIFRYYNKKFVESQIGVNVDTYV